MIGIYKIINKTNNKIYIGQSIHCGKRLDEHCNGKQFIDEVIQVDGIENFSFEILKSVEKDELNYWEDYFIMKFDCKYPKGYNKRWNTNEQTRKEIQNRLNEESQTSNKRPFEALNYGKQNKAKLTSKQYLVYSFLMSISKWDSQSKEQHYYVYKNSFKIKEACQLIGISQPTWRSAIKKLEDESYIWNFDSYFIIEIPNSYAPLDIKLIRFLLPFGKAIHNGGTIISVYSVLYRHWKYCIENNDSCEITINQLRKLFGVNHDAITLSSYKLMLKVFEAYGLIELTTIKRQFNGNPYTSYIIMNVNTSFSGDLDLDLDQNAPDNIEEILLELEQ